MTSSDSVVLGFAEYRDPGQRLAGALGVPYGEVLVHNFPDGESRVTVPASPPERVIICRSLDRPNSKLVEVALAASTLREYGARHLTLVAPYLCYMRQDKAFHPGEAVSQRVVGRWLAGHFDALVTVDPHLHRVHRLEDAVPVSRAVALTATRPMARFLTEVLEAPYLLGPDEESEQWVAAIAGLHGWDYGVARKIRQGDRDVRVELPRGEYGGRRVVLVDDVASTGRTLEAAALGLTAHHPAGVAVLVTHALFLGDAVARLRRAGVARIWSCDTIPHPSNRLHLAYLLAEALR